MIIAIDDFDIDENMTKYARAICHLDVHYQNSDDKRHHMYRHGEVVSCGFFTWDQYPECWAGAWGGTHVLFKITDHSLVHYLHSAETVRSKRRDYEKYSVFNFPYRFRDTVLNSEKTPGRSRLTHAEMLFFSSQMTLEEHQNRDAKLAQFEPHDFSIQDSLTSERPIKLYLAGTDDTSYSATFSSIEEANKRLMQLVENPTWDDLKNDFHFSN
jgi:hypothetical protein